MIPVCSPTIGRLEKEYVQSCLDTGWISSSGDFIMKFEDEWANYCGCKYGVTTTNGTHALELAIAALQLPKGSEVILPSFTIISCAIAIIKNNLKPVFVDARPDTWCMDVSNLESYITSQTSAIMPVHIYGYPVDMNVILDIANKYKLRIIEDAAEAHGAECFVRNIKSWKKCGSVGDVGCFSFYANKIITTGEGGMVITNDRDLADSMKSIRNLCFGNNNNRFLHTGIGSNYRMTNIQASIGLAQLSRIDEILGKKEFIKRYYNANINNNDFQLPPISSSDFNCVNWMYGLVSRNPHKTASYFIENLRRYGVDSRPFFVGLHRQPSLISNRPYPICDWLSEYGFYIPSGVGLTTSEMDIVISALRDLA